VSKLSILFYQVINVQKNYLYYPALLHIQTMCFFFFAVPPAYYAHLAAFRARFYMEPDASDGGSVASGVTTSRGPNGPRRAVGNVAVKPLPELKENVKRVMFYC
jgi:hypothetical protein